MDRTEFKKRMQSLKSYREQNPDKGYWDWRASLPDNLRYTDDTEYDMRGAYESGAQPKLEDDGLYHLPTRDPKSGKILKKSIHPTYFKGLTVDSELGYRPYFLGEDTYTWSDNDGPFIPWQKVEQFDEGGETTIVSPTTGLTINPNTLNFLSKIFLKEHRDERTSATMYRTARAAQGAVGTAIDIGPINIADATIQNTTDDPGEVYFLSLQNQREAMIDRGYQAINTDIETDPYGLVRGAVKRLQDNGREVPVYQINDYSDPNVSREDLIMVPPLKDQNEDFKYAGFAKLRHAGSHPIRYYIHKDTGEVYVRGWDLNDYGGSSAGSGGAYNVYGKIGRWAADKLDEIGTPFVQRSGFVPLKSSLEELNKLRKTYYNEIDKVKANPSYRMPFEISQYPFVYRSIWDFNESESKKNIEKYRKELGFSNGGEVPPDNSPVHVNPITKKPLANGAITPVLDLEDASGFTPIGDILSIRDAYVAAKNKDLLGLGLAGLGVVPFIPTVNRKATQDLIDRAIKQSEKSKQVVDDFYTQRNNVYESMIENEDAFRRAARADKQAGTNYVGTYGQAIRDYLRDPSQYNDDLPMMLFDRDLYGTNIKMQVDPSRPGYITVNPRYKDPDELDDAFKRINPGLVRHEMGHQTDLKAGLQYTDRLADPSKFVSDGKLKEMFPKTHSRLKSTVLNKGSEIKSYMNEFREFLRGERKWEPKESVKSFRRKLDEYSKQFPTLRMIFDSYKSKSDFVRDYNAVPLTDTGTNQNLV